MLTLPTPRRELSLLQLTQPVLLRLYVDAFLAQTMEALLARRPPSRLCTRGHAVSSRLWLAPTRRLLSPGAAQLRPRAQHALAALVAGTLHLSDTLARWGAASHCSACPMCESSPDTLEHRMWACRAEGVPFAPRLPSWLAAAFRSAGPEAVPLVAERLWWEPPVDRASRLELLLAEHRDVELAFFGAEGEAFVAFLCDPEGGPLLHRRVGPRCERRGWVGCFRYCPAARRPGRMLLGRWCGGRPRTWPQQPRRPRGLRLPSASPLSGHGRAPRSDLTVGRWSR